MNINRIVGVFSRRSIVVFFFALVTILIYLHLQSQIFNIQKSLGDSDYGTRKILLKKQLDYFPDYHDEKADDRFLPAVVYNRIPKTGSTSFTHKIYDLTKKNKFFVAHVNISKNALKMSLFDQSDMVRNISLWKEFRPAFFHGHFAFVSFEQFGMPNPLYINILREPLDRLISHYYFLRYGDNLRKGLKRVRSGDKTTFDQCVAQRGHDCQANKLWLQIPLLCGQVAECWKPGSQWALAEAKKNLVYKYLLVGATEQLEDFLVVLEATVPRMFSNLAQNFRKDGNSYLRKTVHKDSPSNKTVSFLKSSKIYKMEKELYDFALKQFNFIKQLTTFTDDHGVLQPLSKQYRYEKVYGPKGILF